MVATRSRPQAWLTKNTTPGDIICYRAFLPANYLAEFLGALFLLIQPENWEGVGSDTPEVVASAFERAYNKTLTGGVCMPTGTILPFAGASLPDGYLWCDGGEYPKEDYPELYNAIGTTWGGNSSVFNVPDLAGRFVVGVGSGMALADMGGAETVTLTVDQIPSHNHALPATAEYGAVAIGEIPAIGPVMAMGRYTNSNGGSQSHENRPPFAALNYIIKT